MTISRKRAKPHFPPIYMNDTLIQEVEEHKHLGFIRPILEYADTVWDNIPIYLKDKLESIQIEAARIVTCATKLCSKSNLYNDTGWVSLSERRSRHKIIKFHEMFHDQAPNYLFSLVPQQLYQVYNYNTRSAFNVQNMNCRTTFYQNSFLPSVIREWNRLPQDVRYNPSKFTLKNYINRDTKKVPTYYNTGCRKGQILHARLRLNCSGLNEHLFQKNIVLSSLCICGQVESSKHYLLECHNYRLIRTQTISTLPIYDIPTLLSGSELISDEENENIFKVVQRFILETRRFGP
ncbi:unnamed protein product [Mytilus coruscus]|uniref:Reverse transcriptase zinc-binding domain-containing protein n=1 Tax=Mytilus coruscus TaxID=42192 RepID=A0A6J8BS84_MYTCO|nr:unnamed protein product [Mytilus coruscus]